MPCSPSIMARRQIPNARSAEGRHSKSSASHSLVNYLTHHLKWKNNMRVMPKKALKGPRKLSLSKLSKQRALHLSQNWIYYHFLQKPDTYFSIIPSEPRSPLWKGMIPTGHMQSYKGLYQSYSSLLVLRLPLHDLLFNFCGVESLERWIKAYIFLACNIQHLLPPCEVTAYSCRCAAASAIFFSFRQGRL